LEVDAALDHVTQATGRGSTEERVRLLRDLASRCEPDARRFLAGLLAGNVRQGALEGVMLDAVAQAAEAPAARVRQAYMLSGSLGLVAQAAMTGGGQALDEIGIELFRPLQPMLAQSADDVRAALARFGSAAFEWKMDGARIQVHKRGDEVRVYTRRLNDVTDAVPEVVEAVRSLRADEAVVDGEVAALRADGSPHPFQTTMRRFGRKVDVEGMRETLPLTSFLFDCLYLDGSTLIDRPAAERFSALERIASGDLLVPRVVTSDPTVAQSFLEQARSAGHEGIMAKALDSPYEMGRRGGGWLKIKPANTLDLVVLAAEWGSGRREGWLSNLHLGARDPETGEFVMLGKTFKGLTDEMLAWQTQTLLGLEVRREGHVVYVRPELLVEIAFNEVQASPRYPGGLALRFARVKAHRPDKGPEDADTIDSVREIFRRTHGE
jgi:DNA ligase-1